MSDTQVRLAILELFLEGRTPDVENVAAYLQADVDEIGAAFDRLASGKALVLAPHTRDIVMAAPFAGSPTDHRVRIGARSYYANCIWDALGIPAMLASAGRPTDAEIETTCADCSARLVLRVSKGTLTADPVDVLAHFAVPARKWWEDIVFT